MITQYILPQDKQNKVNELNKKIEEIKLFQSEKISKLPFKEQRIYDELIKKPAIELLQQEIADTYSKFATKILITLETEEEVREFKKNWGVKERTRVFERIPENRIKEIRENETRKIETRKI